MHDELVSVVIAVYNGERFLATAIDSVLAQDHEPVETIVVDDGSTDASAAIARSRPVRYLRQENAGDGAARNTGIAAARGELIAFVDADDEWLPHKLTTQVAWLRAHPEVDIVHAHAQNFLEAGTERPAWCKPEWLTAPRQAFMPSVFLVRRRVFDEAGGFDTSYKWGSDTELLARAKDQGFVSHMLPDCLVRHRIHGENKSYRQDRRKAALLRMARETVGRQRAPAASGEAPDGA